MNPEPMLCHVPKSSAKALPVGRHGTVTKSTRSTANEGSTMMWGKRAGAYERKRSPPSLPSSGVSIFDSSLLIEFKNYYSTSVILFRNFHPQE